MLMNNLWMEHQIVLVTLSEKQDTLISNVDGIHCIRGLHDRAIITWVVATGLDMYVAERTNQRVTIRDASLMESMSRWEDRNSHGKMKSNRKRSYFRTDQTALRSDTLANGITNLPQTPLDNGWPSNRKTT
jgi:hypothetical protein